MNNLNNSSNNNRAVFFIDTSNPRINQVISTSSSHPFIKPPFPPVIDARELIVKQINGKLPTRSPNAFIIYRKVFLDAAQANGYKLPMSVISTMVSKSWENEPQYVKDEYKKLSKEAFDCLNEMNPKSIKPNKRERRNFIYFGRKNKSSKTRLNDILNQYLNFFDQDMLLSTTTNDYQASPDIDNLYEQQNFVNLINSFVQPPPYSSSEFEIFSDNNDDDFQQFINIYEQQQLQNDFLN
ncbi:13199_t:CDS:2 [Entrophospora sp. SA101]|nr:7466_t:CDS:2 [Entrophospora sp. SA101]CAJ0647127.1 13199_t:CDS:2 [Entrophospora sp. SA101]